MATHGLARRRALTGYACVALVALAGCTRAATSPSTSGKSLTVYLGGQQAPNVLAAEQAACSQLRAQVSAYTVSCQVARGAKISDSARTAIKDTSHSIAYVGETTPGSSADSIGITNAVDLLEVSPTDTATALTQKTPAVSGSPDHYYESFSTYGHTFGRMVPTTAHEAIALTSEMQSAGVRSLYTTGDQSDYGRTLRSEIGNDLSKSGITAAASAAGADGVLYAGSDAGAAASALQAAISANPKLKLFVPSALAQDAFVARLSAPAQRALYASQPGLMPHAVPTSGQAFASDPAALFGYAAVQAVIQALRNAGSQANSRGTVISDFLKLNSSDSVLGPYTINKTGDTSFGSFLIERVRAGRLVPVKAIQG